MLLGVQYNGAVQNTLLLIGGVCFLLILAFAAQVVFLIRLHTCLSRCAPRNRRLEPGQVWMNLIPVFNIVWQFRTVIGIAMSLQAEFEHRRTPHRGDYGLVLGLSTLGSSYLSALFSRLGRLEGNNVGAVVSTALGLGSLVCFVLYWRQIVRYNRELAYPPGVRPPTRDGDEEIVDLEVDPYARFRPKPPTGD